MTRSGPLHPEIAEMLDARIQTLRPHRYVRAAVHRFLSYLHTDFPKLHRLSDLRRDPHLQGWLGSLNAQEPLLSDSTRRLYLIGLRRLLDDIASDGYALQPGLILSADLPAPPQHYPAAHNCCSSSHPSSPARSQTAQKTFAAATSYAAASSSPPASPSHPQTATHYSAPNPPPIRGSASASPPCPPYNAIVVKA